MTKRDVPLVGLYPPRDLAARAERGPWALERTSALETADAWWESSAWGLVMLGHVGNGKSLALAALRLRMLEARPSSRAEVLWLRARMLEQLPWEERAQVVERCRNAHGLLLDELPTRAEVLAKKIGEKTIATLGDILEARGDAGLRTAASSNDPRKDFGALWGDRLVSRLRLGGLDGKRVRWLVDVEGQDLRGVVPPVAPEPGPEIEPEPDYHGLGEASAKVRALLEETERQERAKRRALDQQERRARAADDVARDAARRKVWGALALDELARAATAGNPAALDLLDRVAARAAGGGR